MIAPNFYVAFDAIARIPAKYDRPTMKATHLIGWLKCFIY